MGLTRKERNFALRTSKIPKTLFKYAVIDCLNLEMMCTYKYRHPIFCLRILHEAKKGKKRSICFIFIATILVILTHYIYDEKQTP